MEDRRWRKSGRGEGVLKFETPDGRVAQTALLVGRALRARREHPQMFETRGFSRPRAARSGVHALPFGPRVTWATRPDVVSYNQGRGSVLNAVKA